MRNADLQGKGCAAELVPQAAIDAAVLAASKPVHDDGHTDCFYAGILLAAWPHLQRDAVPLSDAEGLADALERAVRAPDACTPAEYVQNLRAGREALERHRAAYPPAD